MKWPDWIEVESCSCLSSNWSRRLTELGWTELSWAGQVEWHETPVAASLFSLLFFRASSGRANQAEPGSCWSYFSSESRAWVAANEQHTSTWTCSWKPTNHSDISWLKRPLLASKRCFQLAFLFSSIFHLAQFSQIAATSIGLKLWQFAAFDWKCLKWDQFGPTSTSLFLCFGLV